LLTPGTNCFSNQQSSERADSKLIYNQYFQIAQNAIDLLPKKRKQIVELRTKEKFTFELISKRLSISKSVRYGCRANER